MLGWCPLCNCWSNMVEEIMGSDDICYTCEDECKHDEDIDREYEEDDDG